VWTFADEAVRSHGGVGFGSGHDAERLRRDVNITRSTRDSPRFKNDSIARGLVDDGV
jgi:alkylation response protein AidB-like acyl-CoA dehydrogenase